MSGIYGFINRVDHKDNENILRAFYGWHKHFGETGESKMLSSKVGIGARIEHFSDDIDRPNPIFQMKDGRFVVVDALLFNREELLPLIGQPENSRLSDEELLLRLYEKGGRKQLSVVNGDFAMAVVDIEKNQIDLIRDHLGNRPIYFYFNSNLMAFATDLRALATIYGVTPKINEKKFYIIATDQMPLMMRETFLDHAYCVCAGSETSVRFTPKACKVKERLYWRPRRRRIRYPSKEMYNNELRHLVEDAIERRLKAIPGPVGAELSGGLDSSVICLLLNKMGKKPIVGNWGNIPEDWPICPGDDRDVIRVVSEYIDSPCPCISKPEYQLDSYSFIFDPDAASPHVGAMAKYVAQHGSRSIFTGQGGDEGISHRSDRLELLRFGEIGHFLREMWDEVEGQKPRLFMYIRRTLGQILIAFPKAWLGICSVTKPKHFEVLNAKFCEEMKHVKGVRFSMPFNPVFCVMNGGITHRAQACSYLSSIYGVRYLFPYQDYRVMDFALSIPRYLYRAPGRNRVIYRETFDDLMPDALRQVTYKVSPIAEGFIAPPDYEPQKKVRKYVESFNREYWAPYIDLEEMDRNINAPVEQLTKSELDELYKKESIYINCSIIQRIFEKGLDWAMKQACETEN